MDEQKPKGRGGKRAGTGGKRIGSGRKPILQDPVKTDLLLEKSTLEWYTREAAGMKKQPTTLMREVLEQHQNKKERKPKDSKKQDDQR